MTIMEAHQLTAAVAGEMSLAIVKRTAADDVIRQWVRRLRAAADGLERRLAQ